MTVTGRNPVRMAKELATIDRFTSGRLLLVFVPGLTDRYEDQALGVPVAERGALARRSPAAGPPAVVGGPGHACRPALQLRRA